MSSLMTRLWTLSPRGIAYGLVPRFALRVDARAHADQLTFPSSIERAELERLKRLPRFTPGTTTLAGKTVHFIDADSYLTMVHEIFGKGNYGFHSTAAAPVIIDCGANIGLSVIYFKQLHPHATITAFEPDPRAFAALEENVRSFGFDGVELHHRAVWDKQGTISFARDHSWGGHIAERAGANTVEVESVRLKDVIGARHVDFLKIDVEGAETDILLDCAGQLAQLDHLFFEYHSFAERAQALHRILALLCDAGFRYHIKEASPRGNPFVNPTRAGMDMQIDVFAYRVPTSG